VHDYGAWGVVGVIQGVLEEQNFIRVDTNCSGDTNIELHRGGPILLGEGTVSLLLYGQEVNALNGYDLSAGTRQ
jgi:hypothetical protein